MPPRTRTRAPKALKENIDVTENKIKPSITNTKAPRKPLADKTNSASDDASLEIPRSKKTITKSSKTGSKQNGIKKQNVETKPKSDQTHNTKAKQKTVPKENVEQERPRRQRRLPTRFVEDHILNNLSKSKDSVNTTHNSPIIKPIDSTPSKNESLSKSDKAEPSPFKTPAKAESSILTSRPRRIGRLPSRFEDHSISPHKYIPIQPANASTPIQENKSKPAAPNNKINIDNIGGKDSQIKNVPIVRATRLAKIEALVLDSSDNSSEKSSPDSNNNAKGKSIRVQKGVKVKPTVNKKQLPLKTNPSPIKKFFTSINRTNSPLTKTQSRTGKTKTLSAVKNISPKHSNGRKIDKNLSFKVLGGKKTSQEGDKHDLDIYEFTFDPEEEPQPQKKKRKKPVIKKPNAKPQKKVYKSSYDQNISKALAALKTAVKPSKNAGGPKLTQITENSEVEEVVEHNNVTNNVNKVQNTVNKQIMALNDTGKNSVHECNYPSIRVEDIAADMEPSIEPFDHDINYSPVNSPRPNEPMTFNVRESSERSIHNKDPLNLQEELSFFDDQPVASSSMNMSVRHPLASPWRVEFGSLPIKWPINAYVKPNMTPAVDSSYINAEDSNKKKHVYTNIIPQTDDTLPEIVDNAPSFKQTSILSFIKEMAEKSAKKKRGRSTSPLKAVYEEIIDRNVKASKTKKSTKNAKDIEEVAPSENASEEVSGTTNDTSNNGENSKEEKRNRKRKNNENISDRPAKSPRKQKDTNCTYFGFDESENQEQENVSPIKINNNPKRSMRPRSRVLQEINGPTRAALPVAAKTKIMLNSDVVNRVYEELKSAADAPMFPEKNVNDNITNIENLSSNEDSQSVHLFEDIEVVHHLKVNK